MGQKESHNPYPRGSEWRRWDLHIHTPGTILNDEYGGDREEIWEQYIKTIEQHPDVKVIGITDYMSIENYERVINYKKSGRLQNINLIIPNIEFRLSFLTKSGSSINIHILASPVDKDHCGNIKSSLEKLLFTDEDEIEYNCSKRDLIKFGRKFINQDNFNEKHAYKQGIENCKIEIGDFIKWRKDHSSIGIIAIPNSEGDGASSLQHDGSFTTTRKKLYKLADIIFSANPSDRDWFLGKGKDSAEKIIKEYGSLKPCIHGSDAHRFNRLLKPDCKKYCWIKADPTFEGLRQILFEPEDRVKIQDINPNKVESQYYFSKIRTNGKIFSNTDSQIAFAETELPLNRSMVTIIGGRGSGKSLLLDGFRNLFDKINIKEEKGDRVFNSENLKFQVDYIKEGGEIKEYKFSQRGNDLEYLHVSQGEVKNIVVKEEKLSLEIKKLLNIKEDSLSLSQTNVTRNAIDAVKESQRFLKEKNSEGKFINTKDIFQREKKRCQNLINNLTGEKNKSLVESYISNEDKILKIDDVSQKIGTFIQHLKNYKDEFNLITKNLNKNLEDIQMKKIPPLDFKFNDNIKTIEEFLNKLIQHKTKMEFTKKEIEENFDKLGVKDIERTYNSLETYQREINKYEDLIRQIDNSEKTIKNSFETIKNSSKEIRDKINKAKLDIDNSWSKYSNKDEPIYKKLLKDINIKTEVKFHRSVFQERMFSFFDGRKFKTGVRTGANQSLENFKHILNINSYEDYIKIISCDKLITYNENNLIIFDFIFQLIDNIDSACAVLKYLYTEEFKEYVSITCKLTYKNKSPQHLSVGQRGTFYVCVKLATNVFSVPFVFDQPEDDLDNEFIVKELIPIFKEIKKYRQVIIVTHNANFVVNTDAEQVIIAQNDAEKVSYNSGSLEGNLKNNTTVYKKTCEILEGGEAAFNKRRNRYNLP